MSWKTYKLGELLERKRVKAEISPNHDYKLVTIRLWHQGVVLREEKRGQDIKSNMYQVNDGDFVLSGIDARNGAFGIVPKELDGAVVTNDFWCLEPKKNLLRKDFFLFLTSTKFFDYICNQCSDGTTQRIRLQKDKFYDFTIALPPIEEQGNLVESLANNKKANEDLFSELTHQLDLVKQLRQAFLREAMQGKLVRQNPNDEPASVLLEKIKAEKALLQAQGTLKKQKPLPPITEDEIPFEVPENWVWCRLGELIYDTEGGKSPNCQNVPAKGDQWGVIKTTAVQEMIFLENENKILPEKYIVNPRHIVENGDVLITRAGPKNRVGIVCCVEDLSLNLILSDKTIRILHNKELVNSKFMALALNSPLIKPIIESKMTGMADSQVNISQDNMIRFIIPFPPLLEQQRIVAKLDELMAYCDDLEASIKESQQHNGLLLQQVLREALEPKEEDVVRV